MKQQQKEWLFVAVSTTYCSSVSNSKLHSVHPIRCLSDAVGCVLTLREVRECSLLLGQDTLRFWPSVKPYWCQRHWPNGGIYVTGMKGLAFYWELHRSEKIDWLDTLWRCARHCANEQRCGVKRLWLGRENWIGTRARQSLYKANKRRLKEGKGGRKRATKRRRQKTAKKKGIWEEVLVKGITKAGSKTARNDESVN